jgi:hypothetical protein
MDGYGVAAFAALRERRLVVEAVGGEEVSTGSPEITGKNTGKIAKLAAEREPELRSAPDIRGFLELNHDAINREGFGQNRESRSGNREKVVSVHFSHACFGR